MSAVLAGYYGRACAEAAADPAHSAVTTDSDEFSVSTEQACLRPKTMTADSSIGRNLRALADKVMA